MKKYNKNINLSRLLGKPTSLLEKFHNQIKLSEFSSLPDPKDWPEEWTKVFFKEYPRMDKIVLPDPKKLKFKTLYKSLAKRTSIRNFSKTPLSLDQLACLLFYSAGLKKNTSSALRNRFYPSAGSRYPLEIYLVSLNTELARGIYHYNLRSHSLEVLFLSKGIKSGNYFKDAWAKKAPCLVVISSVFSRTAIKYGNRAYREILLEAGHLGQNFYLNSAILNLACCGLSGYVDKKMDELLNIDGLTESVVYVLSIGSIKK